MIEAYISENGTDPVNGEELTTDDLLDLKQPRSVKPRPPTLTSIPALLSTFQNEWDAIILETYQLKQQLAETRQELSSALYYNDSAQRVIARLQKERDEARDALSRVTVSGSNGSNGAVNGDAMQIDGQGLSPAVLAKIEETQQRLSATRRKRPVPEDWATGDAISSYEVKADIDSQFTGAKSLAVDNAGDFFLCGDSDGAIGVYDLKNSAFTTRSNLSAGAILDGAWANDKIVVATSSGSVVVAVEGSAQAKFHQHAGAATAIAVHPCGDVVASVGVDKSYVLYDLEASAVLTQIYADSGEYIDIHLVGTSTNPFYRTHYYHIPPRRSSPGRWRRRRYHQALRRQDLATRPHIPCGISCSDLRSLILGERHLARLCTRKPDECHRLGPAQAQPARYPGCWNCDHWTHLGLYRTVPRSLRARRRSCQSVREEEQVVVRTFAQSCQGSRRSVGISCEELGCADQRGCGQRACLEKLNKAAKGVQALTEPNERGCMYIDNRSSDM